MPLGYIIFLLFFLIVTLGLTNAPVFADPDTAWHLATGDFIRQTHKIPLQDSWSFNTMNEVWYNLSWLFDTGLSFLFSVSGFSGVYALTILVFAGSITAMAWHSGKVGAGPLSILLISLLAAFVVSTGLLARPNMCSVVFVVVFFHLLCEYRDHGNIKKVFPLPPLMCLWVNLHGGFLVAFPIIGIFWLEAALKRNVGQRTVYLALIALCLMATVMNPYGFAVYYGAYKSAAAAFSYTTLNEWQPVAIGRNIQMTLLLLATLLIGDFTDKKIAWSDRAIAVLFLFLSLMSFRYASIAALLMMPYLSLRLSQVLYASPMGDRIRAREHIIISDMKKKDMVLVSAAFFLFACLMVYLPHPRDEILKEPAGFSQDHFPVAEASFIEQHYPKKRFFNSYNIGGYLDYLWRGRIKVFVDGRSNSVYSDDVLDNTNYICETHGFGARAKMLLKYYKIDGLIIAGDDKDASLWNMNPDWKKVYEGKAAMVFVRK